MIALRHEDYKVAWICALPLEMAAIQAMLDETHDSLPQPTTDYNYYALGRISGHNVVVACLPSGMYGISSASMVVTQMLVTFSSVQYGLMVGIGGGVPSDTVDIRLGDVVVGKPNAISGGVIQYDYGKTFHDGRFQRTGTLNKPPQPVLTALSRVEAKGNTGENLLEEIIHDTLQHYPKMISQFSKPNEDWLFHANYVHLGDSDCSTCDPAPMEHRAPRTANGPQVHYGLIASGNQVMKDAQTRDQLAQDLGIICFDMEAAGLIDTFPGLVIRGICDYSDTHKSKKWQGYAALTASAYGKLLLSNTSVTPRKHGESTTGADESDMVAKVASWILTENITAAQYDLLNQAQPGTGLWLMKSREYSEWFTGCHQTLFLQGPPGAGKTILSVILAEKLRKEFIDQDSVGVAAVFCDFKKRHEQSLLYYLSSILKQLIQYRDHLPEAVKVLYEFHIARKTRPRYDDLSNALQSMIEDSSKTFLIVDGLDECDASDGTLKSLLDEIARLQKQGRVGVFATSRPIPDIAREFEFAVQLDMKPNDNDIRTFIESYTPRFKSPLRDDPMLQNKVRDYIIDAANGTFLPAKLFMDSIVSKPTRKHVEALLDNLMRASDIPKTLQALYEQSMDRIMDQDLESKNLAIRTLSWIACGRKALSVSELQHALAVENGKQGFDERNIPEVDSIISVCCGLVLVDESRNISSVVHRTFHTWLQQNQKIWLPDAEKDIATTCLTYLSYKVFEDGPCLTVDDYQLRLQSYPFLAYAAHNWGYHVVTCMLEDNEIVLSFLGNPAKLAAAYQVIVAASSVFDRSQIVTKQVTGLHIAAYFGMQRAVAILLEKGHPPTPVDFFGQTPLWWAAKAKHMGTMTILSKWDEVTLQMLIKQGDIELVRLLLVAGCNFDTKGFWNRSPLHEAILSRNIPLTRELISLGADTNLRDSDNLTALQLAVRRADHEFIELLLKNLAKEDGIMSSEWRHAFQKDSSLCVHLSENEDSGKTVTFWKEENISWFQHDHERPLKSRSLGILAEENTPGVRSIPIFGDLRKVRFFKIYTQSIRDCEHCFRYSIMVSLPKRPSFKKYYATRDATVGIAWTTKWFTDPDSHQTWKSIEHFSTLPYGWTPKNGIEFIGQFISIVEKRWIELCNAGLSELYDQRRKILFMKGDNPTILDNLLTDAQIWTIFRIELQREADDIISFMNEYNRRHSEIRSVDVQGIVQNWLDRVNERIDELDATSKSLIQTEFNLVSINEAHKSTSTAASMKRLSWITFVFLPATFASSLFGMNVNVLQDNPDWRWVILFVAVILFVTLVGWLVFKYNPIEHWIERKAYGIIRYRKHRSADHDVEKITSTEVKNDRRSSTSAALNHSDNYFSK